MNKLSLHSGLPKSSTPNRKRTLDRKINDAEPSQKWKQFIAGLKWLARVWEQEWPHLLWIGVIALVALAVYVALVKLFPVPTTLTSVFGTWKVLARAKPELP
jgi:hypothetical protein